MGRVESHLGEEKERGRGGGGMDSHSGEEKERGGGGVIAIQVS